MEYTPKQKEYIDSVSGEAHQSAVRIIGELEAEPEPTEFTEQERNRLAIKKRSEMTGPEIRLLYACDKIDLAIIKIKRQKAEHAKLNEIINKYARHKQRCKMGEYNTIIRGEGKGCDCGLMKALE